MKKKVLFIHQAGVGSSCQKHPGLNSKKLSALHKSCLPEIFLPFLQLLELFS